MDIFGFKPHKNQSNDRLNEIIAKIREGDSLLREKLTDDHKTFILNIVLNTLGKSSLPLGSPEFNIAVSAFSYSIDHYDLNDQNGFLVYSEQIIKEWVISYIRDDSTSTAPSHTVTEKNYLYYTFESKEEISLLKKNLWEFGIKLLDVSHSMPKTRHSILFSLKIAKIISGSNTLFDKLLQNKSIPIKDFDEAIKSSKKLIHKYRKYIITLTLILKSDLKVIKSYLKNIGSVSDSNENMGVILKIVDDEALLFTIQGKIITIRIKGKKVGEQIQFGNYRIRKSKELPNYYLVAGVSVFVLVLSTFLIVHAINNRDKSPETIKEPASTYIPAANPTNTEAPPAVVIEPSPTPTPIASPSLTATPSATPAAARKTPDKNSPTPRPPITSASDVPDEVRISATSYKVSAGDKYEVHMYMKSGNNGTRLILYQNEKEYKTFDLKDRTPWPQARIVEIQSENPGTYTYRWDLINDFGNTSSKTITVQVLDN